MPVALGLYGCSRLLPFSTSKASGAEAQNRSTWLLPLVSSRNFTPALVLRFCTARVVPGTAFSKACLIVSVTSLEKEVTTVTLPPCADAVAAKTSPSATTIARSMMLPPNDRGSGGLDEAVQDLLGSGLLELDVDLVAVDRDDAAVAEFLVEHALPDAEVGLVALDGAAIVERLVAPARAAAPDAGHAQALIVEAARLLAHAAVMAGGIGGVEARIAALRQLLGRQLAQEARGDGSLPLVEDAAIGGERDVGSLARPRQADIGQPALLLEPGQALVVERALVGEQAFLPARQEHGVELQPLGGMQRHDAHHVAAGALGIVGEQCHVLEEGGQGVEFLQGVGQLLQVLQAPLGLGRTIEAQHVGVARLFQNRLDDLDMVHAVEHGAPAIEVLDEISQRLALTALELVGFQRPPRRLEQRHLLRTLDDAQRTQGRFAQAPARRVVD